MNEPENQILKSEIFKKKKRNMKMPCFLFKLQGSEKATQLCFRFLKRFLVSLIKLLLFQGQRFLMWKEKRFNVFSATLWAKQKVILISLTPRDYQLQFIVSCLRPIKLSTLFSHELLAFISVSRHFWSHHPNKACLFLKGLPAKKLNLVIVILFPLRKIFLVQ